MGRHRGSVHQRAYRKYTIAAKGSTMDRISGLCNHKRRKGKICATVRAIIAVVLPWIPVRGGGDSSHGKVCELTSSGIKRGSASTWTGTRVPGLIHELFRYERPTRFSCLADFSIGEGQNSPRRGLLSLLLGSAFLLLQRAKEEDGGHDSEDRRGNRGARRESEQGAAPVTTLPCSSIGRIMTRNNKDRP